VESPGRSLGETVRTLEQEGQTGWGVSGRGIRRRWGRYREAFWGDSFFSAWCGFLISWAECENRINLSSKIGRT
jgi:hypothetical protein